MFENLSWFGVVELCFEGVIDLRLTPPPENAMNDMYSAILKVEDERILWAQDLDELDGGYTIDNFEYDQSYIKALNLKWRKVG